jgi:ATPase subunit of ABC transporter with duplicated ATPase domains
LNLNLKNNSLVGIVGRVGSGKSTFLNAILQELETEKGELVIHSEASIALVE